MLLLVAMMLAGAWLGLLLIALLCLLLSKVLKSEWEQEYFAYQFWGLRFLLTFGIWK